MQVSVEICEDLVRKLNITIPAERVDVEVKNRIVSTAKNSLGWFSSRESTCSCC